MTGERGACLPFLPNHCWTGSRVPFGSILEISALTSLPHQIPPLPGKLSKVLQTRGKTLTLDMAPDTFDDAYTDCVEDMEQVAPILLQEEMAQHKLFRESWEAARASFKSYQNLSLPPGFQTQHALAVMVYTNSSNSLHRELNLAVRELGSSIEAYLDNFPFKALHFYLMRALQLLRNPESCKEDSGQEVFRGKRSTHFKPRKLGDIIRLGQFTSTSEERKVAQMFGNATFFTLSTCFGVPIKDLSVFPNEREVLIPPNEVFQVSNFSQDGTQNLVTLRSLKKTCSNFNCAYLKKEKIENCELKSGNINSTVLGKVTPWLFVGTQLLLLRIFCLTSS
ncbi:ecto-ADP-ribosyltransferase 5-like [Trichosurus vulpecula]|uniref:ecto-ADP-ribosyltransferase 5-like n=1 Tax=Trichosurus vulpecula TaxID=9337 RepID=UPI00186AC9DA|nr:ecto-ADP-ribosyltransferase 5-like [Trichosurus vulpecula]